MNKSYFFFKNQLVTALFCSLIAITTSIVSKTNPDHKAPTFEVPTFTPLEKKQNVIIVIPAYNEENRIAKTLNTYVNYFKNVKDVSVTFLVVCNNCKDSTVTICKKIQKNHPEVHCLDIPEGGKGLAIKVGFLKALEYENIDLIGFVDADLATEPPYFYELINKIGSKDGIIASRYKKDARVWPNRPFIKRVGGKFYNWILRKNFHLDIRDTQCGAKLFTYKTIEIVAPHMKEIGWAFDLELLYICQLCDKNIIEIPTTWTDVPGSHLTISGAYKEFITAPKRIKENQKELAIQVKKNNIKKKQSIRKEKKVESIQNQYLWLKYKGCNEK